MLGWVCGWWDGRDVALEGSLMVVVNLDGNGVFGEVWVIGNGWVCFGGQSGLNRLYYCLPVFSPAKPLWRPAFLCLNFFVVCVKSVNAIALPLKY